MEEIFSEEYVLLLLSRAIKKAGNQSKYAEKLGVTRSYISAVVRGKKPIGASILRDLCIEKRKKSIFKFVIAPMEKQQAEGSE